MFRLFDEPALLHDSLRTRILRKASRGHPIYIVFQKRKFQYLTESLRHITVVPELRVGEVSCMDNLAGRRPRYLPRLTSVQEVPVFYLDSHLIL